MMTCRDISKLVSDSLDRGLPLRLRMELRLHLLICGFCRDYRKRTLLMRKVLRMSLNESPGEQSIPEETARRIQEALNAAAAEK